MKGKDEKIDRAEFYVELLSNQQSGESVPSNETVTEWAEDIIKLLFPQLSRKVYKTVSELEAEMNRKKEELIWLMKATKACKECNNEKNASDFFDKLPEVYEILKTDIAATISGDPAARNEFEVIRAYPGFYALCFYRIAHLLFQLDVPLLPRILTEQAHSKTGIDIHPAARIGSHFLMDHGTGIVIGETAKIGKHVKIYQGVTLGALSVEKSMAFTKRHPTVEDHVVIYSGATILGGDTIIGHHSIIGGNVWLTRSVAPGSLVYHNPEITVIEGKFINI